MEDELGPAFLNAVSVLASRSGRSRCVRSACAYSGGTSGARAVMSEGSSVGNRKPALGRRSASSHGCRPDRFRRPVRTAGRRRARRPPMWRGRGGGSVGRGEYGGGKRGGGCSRGRAISGSFVTRAGGWSARAGPWSSALHYGQARAFSSPTKPVPATPRFRGTGRPFRRTRTGRCLVEPPTRRRSSCCRNARRSRTAT